MAQTETELFKLLPETASNPQNSERRISEDATRMNLTVPDDVRDMMLRLKELWAHADPSMDNVEVMRRAFKLALAKSDPTEKSKRAAQPTSRRNRPTTSSRSGNVSGNGNRSPNADRSGNGNRSADGNRSANGNRSGNGSRSGSGNRSGSGAASSAPRRRRSPNQGRNDDRSEIWSNR